MRFSSIIIFTLFSISSLADDWICKSQSSDVIGDTFLSCGIGVSRHLSESRSIARDSAVKEFESVCKKSQKCQRYEVSVVPKRTDCSKVEGQYHCYRAIEFTLTENLKKEVVVKVSQVQSQLIEKRKELEQLNTALDSLIESKKLDKEITQKKMSLERQFNEIDKDSIRLSRMVSDESISNKEYKYTHLLYKNSLRVYGGYYGLDFGGESEINIGVGLEYEWRPFQLIGIFGGVLWGGDFQGGLIRSDSDIPNAGSPNSTQNKPGEQSFNDTYLGVTVYPQFYGLYFKGSVGKVSFSKEMYTVSYNGLGVSSHTQSTVDGSSVAYKGMVGYDHRNDYKGYGWFIEGGVVSFEESSVLGVISNVGFNFGF